MATQVIEIQDVKTKADVNKIFFQKCTHHALEVSLGTYVCGIIAIPIALRNFHKRIPIPIEYKMAIGAVSMITISYFAGTYAKARCERNLRKQLHDLQIEV